VSDIQKDYPTNHILNSLIDCLIGGCTTKTFPHHHHYIGTNLDPASCVCNEVTGTEFTMVNSINKKESTLTDKISDAYRICGKCNKQTTINKSWICCPSHYEEFKEICNTCYREFHPQVPLSLDDSVNHPSHYTAYNGLEVIDLTEQMNFNRGNAVKYICRAGLKGDNDTEIEDLQKAIWYLNRELERTIANAS
jgi:hypothetical protein